MTPDKKRVLVVDDDREMTAILQKVLTRENYEVLTAENGEDAIDTLRSKPAQVVIADWKMPVCDGMRLIDILREGFPDVKLIMITAFGEVDTYLDAMSRGAFEFLSKPLNIDELKMLVNRAANADEIRATAP